MTRLAILADVHGNLPALEAVLADLATFAAEYDLIDPLAHVLDAYRPGWERPQAAGRPMNGSTARP